MGVGPALYYVVTQKTQKTRKLYVFGVPQNVIVQQIINTRSSLTESTYIQLVLLPSCPKIKRNSTNGTQTIFLEIPYEYSIL